MAFNPIDFMGFTPEERERRMREEMAAQARSSTQKAQETQAEQQAEEPTILKKWGERSRGEKASAILTMLSNALAAGASNDPGRATVAMMQEQMRARQAARDAKTREAELAAARAERAKESELAREEKEKDRGLSRELTGVRVRATKRENRLNRELTTSERIANHEHELGLTEKRAELQKLLQRENLTAAERRQARSIEADLFNVTFSTMNAFLENPAHALEITKAYQKGKLTESQSSLMDQATARFNEEQARERDREAAEIRNIEARTDAAVANSVATMANAPVGVNQMGDRIPLGVGAAAATLGQPVPAGAETAQAPPSPEAPAAPEAPVATEAPQAAPQFEQHGPLAGVLGSTNDRQRIEAQKQRQVSLVVAAKAGLETEGTFAHNVVTSMVATGVAADRDEATAALIATLPHELQIRLQGRGDIDPIKIVDLYNEDPNRAFMALMEAGR